VTRRPVVALLGDLNVDVTLQAGDMPPPGGEVHGEALLTQGGSAGLTARWLAALGCEVRLAAAVGQDPFGEWLQDALARDGAPTSWVQRIPGRLTGICFAVLDHAGERTLLVSPGASRDLAWVEVPPSWLEGADWLHLSGYAWLSGPEREAAEQALRVAQARGIPVSLDPGAMAATLRQELDPLPAFDLLLPNRREIRDITGAGDPQGGATELRRRGARWVATKLDVDGCFIAGPLGEASVPSWAVEAANTTGAGDAFNAGAILGVLSGWAPDAVGALANVLGGAAARSGGGGPLPALPDLLALLHRGPAMDTIAAWLREHWLKGG